MHALDASNHGCNKIMIHTADVLVAVQLHALSYIIPALHAEEVNEQRKEVHAVDMYSTYSSQATLLEHTKRAA